MADDVKEAGKMEPLRETLHQQLRLLAERSKKCRSNRAFLALTREIREWVQMIYKLD